MAEDTGDINRGALEAGISGGDFLERQLGGNYAATLRTLNNRLFTDSQGKFTPGWRDRDVSVAGYLAPNHQNVTQLLDIMGEKVGVLERTLAGNSREKEKLAAWVMLMILKIHPRLDGNGRLVEAAAEQLVPGKVILGVPFDGWDAIERLSVADTMNRVSRMSGQPIPDLLVRLNENFGSHDLQELERTMNDFYRYGGRDWVSEVLKQEVDEVSVDNTGHLNLNYRALNGMAVLINEAPKRPSRPNPKHQKPNVVRRLVEKLF